MRRSESGQVAVLVIGLTMVVFAVIGVAIDGTRAFLYRRTLQNAADGAATSAASGLDVDEYYASGGQDVALDPARARAVAQGVLARRGIDAASIVIVETSGITVQLRGEVPTTFLGLIGVDRLPVAVEAVAVPLSIP